MSWLACRRVLVDFALAELRGWIMFCDVEIFRSSHWRVLRCLFGYSFLLVQHQLILFFVFIFIEWKFDCTVSFCLVVYVSYRRRRVWTDLISVRLILLRSKLSCSLPKILRSPSLHDMLLDFLANLGRIDWHRLWLELSSLLRPGVWVQLLLEVVSVELA